MTVTLRYSARSDIGLVRQTNQDSGYAGPHLCAMCDGMGGPAGGDIASAIAIEHLAPLDADSHQASEMLGLLREAIQSTHTDLVTLSNQDPDLAGHHLRGRHAQRQQARHGPRRRLARLPPA